MAFLRIERGDHEGATIELTRDKIVLGRSPDCDEIISKNEAVSRWHAQILCKQNGFFIEDLKSRNKTYLNDEELPFQKPAPLKHKDIIRICDFQATFLESLDDGGENSSTVEAIMSSSSDLSLETQPAAKLAILLEITAKLSKTLELDTQLPEVADGLLRIFPQADRCFLILTEKDSEKLLPKVVRTRGNVDPSIQQFSKSIVRQCLHTSQAILLREGDVLPISATSSNSVVTANMRSVMCVPLCPAEGRPFGVIQLDTQDAAKKFTEDDLHLLWGVAHQATVSMENARYHELRLAQQRLKNEMEMAHQVQLVFLPQHMPVVPGYEFFSYYEPAREVGGDYYDFVPLPEGRLAVILGDVAGKGMPAALLMARLSSESRFCFLTERHPTSAVSRLNDLLHPVTSPMDRFVTMVAAVLEPATHKLTLISAGHLPPLWYRHAERKFAKAVPADDDGRTLGIAPDSRYRCYDIQLLPGDAMLLYSDGVTDAQSLAGKAFRAKGIHGIIEHVPAAGPRALGERLVEAVRRHAHGVPQYDDITLICFGRPASC